MGSKMTVKVVVPFHLLLANICFSKEQQRTNRNLDFPYFSLHKAPPPFFTGFCLHSTTATGVLPMYEDFP
jgi:hypothetical protein